MRRLSDSLEVEVVPCTPFLQNSSVLRCPRTGAGALVDPGEAGPIERVVAREGLEVEKVLVTHGHVDHASAVAELAERYGVPIEGPHEADRFWIESLADQGRMFGLRGGRSFEPDRWLEEGDRVRFGEVELEVLHCPGHTPGHVVLFHRPSRFALVGDVLFQGSIGRTDFPRGDYDTLLASIRDKLLPLGDDVLFLPGHGPTSTFGRERAENPFLLHPERYRGLA